MGRDICNRKSGGEPPQSKEKTKRTAKNGCATEKEDYS